MWKNSVCNTAVASAKITYYETSRKRRRLNENDVSEVENKIEQIIYKHSEGLAAIIENVDGLSLVNVASNIEDLVQTTPTISSVNEASGGNIAKVIVPIVIVVFVIALILGAYIQHRRRRNAIVVELEEEDVEDDHLLPSSGQRRNRKNRDMKFPIASKEETSSGFPDMDLICGTADSSSIN